MILIGLNVLKMTITFGGEPPRSGLVLYIKELNMEELPGMTPSAHIIEYNLKAEKALHTIYGGAQILPGLSL